MSDLDREILRLSSQFTLNAEEQSDLRRLQELKKATEKQTERGTKYNSGKPRISLIPPEFILGVAEILTFGANKYGDYNWCKGIPYSELMDALDRHMLAFKQGIDTDDESKKSHLLHAACNIVFLYWMSLHKKDQDDRFKVNE